MARTGTAADLQPIDRLEDKVRQLVSMVNALRGEREKALGEAARLQRELDAARARVGEAAQANAEIATLREERDLIKGRVTQMIAQIDQLNL
jgi:regulator of replication initiation timing